MATREFLTTIDVDAPVAEAWRVLTEFGSYGEWCPTHREIQGAATPGGRLRISLARTPGGSETFTVPATVRAVEPPNELAFGGGVPGAPWLFDIHHWFRLESLGESRCRLHNGERFQGLLMIVLGSVIAARVESGYAAFNTAFKRRCEATRSSS